MPVSVPRVKIKQMSSEKKRGSQSPYRVRLNPSTLGMLPTGNVGLVGMQKQYQLTQKSLLTYSNLRNNRDAIESLRTNGYHDASVQQLKRDLLLAKLRSRRPSNELAADFASRKMDLSQNVEDGIVGKKLVRQEPAPEKPPVLRLDLIEINVAQQEQA